MRNTILVVEQDILVRHPLAHYLRDCGYHVIEVAGQDEARKAFARTGLEIDVVLISTQSAGESSFALATWIRSRAPKVEVVLGGTIARSLQMAGGLCDDGRAPHKAADYRPVLQRIQSQLAHRAQARDDKRHE